MIAFIGDSFTWGQGLQYYYLTKEKGWSWQDCENFVNSYERFEWLGYEADEFRKLNNFSSIVSKKLDVSFLTPRMENGGDNFTIYEILKNLQPMYSVPSIFLVVIQFSAPTRSIENGSELKFKTIEENIYHQVKRINDWSNDLGVKWIGLSWLSEIGEILKKDFPNNYIPIEFENVEYNSFDFEKYENLKKLTINYSENISDFHFNLYGHEVISNCILKKIESMGGKSIFRYINK